MVTLRNNGFTLIEVLISVCVLCIGLFSVAYIFAMGPGSINEAREIAIATQAVQEEMELIKSMDFDDMLNVSSSFTSFGLSALANSVGTVTVDNPESTDDMRRVTVSATWNTARGSNPNIDLVTLITRD